MDDLMKLCGFSIALSKATITPQHIPFQRMVEQHYQEMKKKVKQYIE